MTDGLSTIQRLITTHNAQGQAVFHNAIGETAEQKPIGNEGVMFGLQYCSEEFPADLNNDKDIEAYRKYSGQAPGLVISGGTVLRTVGMDSAVRCCSHCVLIDDMQTCRQAIYRLCIAQSRSTMALCWRER